MAEGVWCRGKKKNSELRKGSVLVNPASALSLLCATWLWVLYQTSAKPTIVSTLPRMNLAWFVNIISLNSPHNDINESESHQDPYDEEINGGYSHGRLWRKRLKTEKQAVQALNLPSGLWWPSISLFSALASFYSSENGDLDKRIE